MRIPIAALALALLLGGCGGGEQGAAPQPQQPPVAQQPPPPPPPPAVALVVTGQFKDANVAGLSFSSGDEQGITDETASFTCEENTDVSFSVGAVTIGAARCDTVITPLDLFVGSTLDTPEVLNVVRFLMLLDVDGDPGNGIVIADNIRNLAADWSAVDFSASNFEAEIANIVDALTNAGQSPVLADVATARTHLLDTVACAHSGFYWLWFGPKEGPSTAGYLTVYPQEIDGVALAGGGAGGTGLAFSAGADGITYGDSTRLDFDNDTGDATFSADFVSIDQLDGQTFYGDRAVAPIPDARYRFVGFREGACCLDAYTIELLGDNRALATGSTLPWWDLPYDVGYEGTLEAGKIEFSQSAAWDYSDGGSFVSDGGSFVGNVDLEADPPTITIGDVDPIVAYGCKIG